jgi:hypothetical protein
MFIRNVVIFYETLVFEVKDFEFLIEMIKEFIRNLPYLKI